MALALKIAGGVILFLMVGLCLLITVLPRFLDRIYYEGTPGDHFDGERFFNPDGDADTFRMPAGSGGRAGFFWRYLTGKDGRPKWPERIAVTPGKPEPRIEGERMVATWIGHATVLIQTQGLNILTDPVWSANAGPFGTGPKRVAEPGVRFEDLPKIDLILVSHNHYDHLDKATLKRLSERDRPRIVTSLGNDSVIAQTGAQATALDWGQRIAIGSAIEVIATRNHHWGSRWFTDRNRALWSSFVIRLPGGNVFFAGDTGLGDGKWPAEAAALGPIRFAMIPIGAFRFARGQMGAGSHIGPLDAVRVFDRLGATTAMPIHWGTFRLSYEGYETPPKMLATLLRCSGVDTAAFAPAEFGRAIDVPAYAPATRRIDEAALERCARTADVTALP